MRIPLFEQYYQLENLFYPVGLHDLFFDRARQYQKVRRPGNPRDPELAEKFLGVVAEDCWTMLACVSQYYTLITNQWAYEKGLKVIRSIFGANEDEISCMQCGFLSPERGSCFIDLSVNRNLKVKSCEHSWTAFVHIKNSYDCSCSLRYEVGFCLETMDNRPIPIGLLIPSLSLNFSANHSWSLNTIEKKLDKAIASYAYSGSSILDRFEMMVNELLKIQVVDDEILSLFCKLAKIKKINAESEADRELAHRLISIERSSRSWISKCGANAYAALCAFADFATSNYEDLPFVNQPSEFESQLGKFIEELLYEHRIQGLKFDLDNFIGKEARDVRKQIKLICMR